ncbi:undecaprenyl-diphosphate phosphatase [Undibacterium sp. Jales W-56]|uniref:undecaprenyl-diphosphate phosphatase n=1 Tax=Undibacterium sp. Jales W-56 TaxID=2897325 RepID=UPI0021D0940F|nr:undecaprenyl-diphosphate phosphatase [Undibacterium sp. Jales W-56]MCU6434666.1 undecaprenyl-diphosphate phosphatase [Undibacterium sp. Jales W-56]
MDILFAVKIIIMGIVEGLTEFLPISSTGHLILTGSLLNFTTETAKVFDIVIQAGAIFAVCWEYRQKIASVLLGLASDAKARKFALNLVVAFLPAAILGVLFIKKIKAHLFAPVPVASAFIVGGLIILWVERKRADANGGNAAADGATDSHDDQHARIHSIDDMTIVDALKIGFAQSFGLIPGMSRSGSTIIGGMLFGLSRKAATEFSFFLAIPTLLGATVFSLFKARNDLSGADLPMFSLGTIAAFISAFFCVRWLLRYISSHNFNVFAWYRIAFGIMILITAYTGTIAWVD